MSATDCVSLEHRKIEGLTYRESRVAISIVDGSPECEALKLAGFGPFYQRHPNAFPAMTRIREEVARLQDSLSTATLEYGLIDALEIHEYLTDALRARISDIRRDDGSYLPTSEWPDIWQRMYEAGDVEIEELSERSNDGATKGKRGGWDGIGTVTKVKIKFASRAKLLELAMKHRGVNAMVNPNDKLGEGLSDLAGSIDRAIAEGRQRASQRNRVIDVKSENRT